jgi:hypothetical protein
MVWLALRSRAVNPSCHEEEEAKGVREFLRIGQQERLEH